MQKIRYWEVAIIPVSRTTQSGLRKPPCDLPMDGNKRRTEFPSLEMNFYKPLKSSVSADAHGRKKRAFNATLSIAIKS